MNWKIVRGYYLTALGQESECYYFKTTERIVRGDVAMTFYQNNQIITAIPALIRVDLVKETEIDEEDFLEQETVDHIPFLPLVMVYKDFELDNQLRIEEVYSTLKKEMKELSDINYTQGNLFDFLEDA